MPRQPTPSRPAVTAAPRPRFPRLLAGLAVLALATNTSARGREPDRPTLELLKLVAPDAVAALTVDDLRGQVREILDSPLAKELQNLPLVKAWFDSEKYRQIEKSRDQIEAVLQVSLTEIRDRIFGDALVLALHYPPGAAAEPDSARGVLLVKAGDPELLRKVLEVINTTQTQNGELSRVREHAHGTATCRVREFPAGMNHPSEAYVIFPDGSFAMSNAEELIHRVIDRKAGTASGTPPAAAATGSMERFLAADRRLPQKALARLYLEPRTAEELLRQRQEPRTPDQAAIESGAGALESAGAALVVRDGRICLHTAAGFEPGRFRALLGGWAEGVSPASLALDHVPSTALAVASLDVDFAALYQGFLSFVPERDRIRMTNLETALKGIFLGLDPRTQILPGLGPRLFAVVDTPTDWPPKPETDSGKSPFPTVIGLELKPEPAAEPARPTVAAALDNVLNMLLALGALNEKFAEGRARIVTREVSGATVKTLEPAIPFAYTVDPRTHRLVLGSSLQALENYLAASSDTQAAARFRQLQALAFPGVRSFLCVDLAAVEAAVTRHRDRLTESIAAEKQRSREEVSRDLDQLLAVVRVFDAAFLTSRIDSKDATVHHTLGLLAREPGREAPATPAR